jgi:hypothetical protein
MWNKSVTAINRGADIAGYVNIGQQNHPAVWKFTAPKNGKPISASSWKLTVNPDPKDGYGYPSAIARPPDVLGGTLNIPNSPNKAALWDNHSAIGSPIPATFPKTPGSDQSVGAVVAGAGLLTNPRSRFGSRWG